MVQPFCSEEIHAGVLGGDSAISSQSDAAAHLDQPDKNPVRRMLVSLTATFELFV